MGKFLRKQQKISNFSGQGIVLVFALFLMSGCASIESINKNYTKINLRDGISKNEARIMAQKALLDSGRINKYIYERPIFDNDLFVRKRYLNYAFIHFAPVDNGDEGFLIIINEKLGEVRYAGPFNIVQNKDYDIFFN